MPTLISTIESLARTRLDEITPRFWTSAELTEIIIAGLKDLWRDTANLKQEHFMSISTDVFLAANATSLSNVPVDVHKIINIAPSDLTSSGSNYNLSFQPSEFNSAQFQSARSRAAIDPQSDIIYYAITGQGSPVGAPIILIAPTVTSQVSIELSYVPTLSGLINSSVVPIPGEADNALVAWTVAYARAKERDDRMPDPGWMSIYSTEKAHLLESLGLRQYQEPSYVEPFLGEYW